MCRAFLSPWKDENGEYKFEGRFNQNAVTINLPQIGIISGKDENQFWQLLDKRLEVVREALQIRHKLLKGVKAKTSPIHWQYGALARLDPEETIDKLLVGGYSTITLGYIGLYETSMLVKGVSNTDSVGQEFTLKVLKYMKDRVTEWSEQDNISYALYGTPAESLVYRFAKLDRNRFGNIKNVTDKGYYTNSYHVKVTEEIDAFSKIDFESEYQKLSTGGCISYVEIPNMNNNLEALETMVRYIYDHISYAEFNTKSDYCHVCGFDGEIFINNDNEWECPQCHNKNKDKLTIIRRTCGYLGENFWNEGKTKEIKDRVLHI